MGRFAHRRELARHRVSFHRGRVMKLRVLLLAFLTGALLNPLAAVPRFPHEASDLPADPAARFGQLPNGVRYIIYPNKEPQGRASLRLLVLAGSLHEEEDQRGLAHFLEHMAFNGSQRYAPGTLVEFFQRMGMSFGGDTNAFTSFDRTQYMLELPKTDAPTLTEGFQVLADYAGGLLLQDVEIDKERGIIASERLARDNVGFRTFLAQFEFLLGQSRLPQRIPIGQPEVVAQAPRERFTDFWNTWYRPEKLVVVAVGDFDAAQVEPLITAEFAALTARAPARPDPALGELARFDGVRTHFHPEPEAPATTVTLTSLSPDPKEPDTTVNRVKYLPRSLALAMLNRRFSELAKKEGAPFSGAGAGVSDQYDFVRQASVTLTCKPGQWADALAVGEQELRRALEHGFQPGELKEVVASFSNSLDQAVKTAATRRSGPLANEIAGSIANREVFTHPVAERALLQPALERVTAADCLAALRAAYAAPGRYVLVTGNVAIPGDAGATIAAAYEKSRAVAVAAPAAQADAVWAYADWGPAGEVVKREHVADLDLVLVTFANGVKLNLKKTDFEAGRIRVSVRAGDGLITEPAGQRGLISLVGGTFGPGGLGKHSTDELRRLLAGRNVGLQFGPGPDAFILSGGTTRDDLLLQFQLLAAHLTDAGWRPEALRQARKGIEQMYLGFAHTANGPMALEVANLLASGDPRFGMPAMEVMMARNLDEAKAWLAPQLARGALEVAVVGDLDLEATIAAAARTLGALPPREARRPVDELKQVKFPAEPFNRTYTISTEIPKGNVYVYWPTTDGREAPRARRLSLLAGVLNDRLRVKIREEIGGTYSPNAGSNAGDVFPGYGYVQAGCVVDPAQAAQIADLIVAIGDDLARNGVTEDELTRARQPALTAARESLRTNAYWDNAVLARAQEKPEVLDWARTRLSDLEAITAAELSELAKAYLGKERASRVTILPAAPAAKPAVPAAPAAPAVPALPAPQSQG
jgi:zinc protease